MFHIDTLWIENYRALQGLRLERCGAVNLLMGHNNSGKTSVLEGLYLFARPSEGSMPPRTARGAFHDDGGEFLLVHADSQGQSWQGRIWMENNTMRHEVMADNAVIKPGDRPQVWFIPPIPEDPTTFPLYTPEELTILADVMRDFDPNVLKVTQEGTVITEYGQMDMESFGEGTRKGVAIADAMIKVKGGIALIDEVEAAFHPRVVPQFGRTLWNLSERLQVQLFITTHSLDWIDTLLEIPEAREKLVGYRLEFDGEKILARRFTHGRLTQMRQTLGLDVR